MRCLSLAWALVPIYMATERPLKRLALADLGGLKRISDAGLSAVLRGLQHQGLLAQDTPTSERSIQRAVAESVETHCCIVGKPIQILELPLAGGGTFLWDYVNPVACFNYFTFNVPEFSDLLCALYRAAPPTPQAPWRMIAYTDEATPGNLLSADNVRRTHALYWSLLEFGEERLMREACWFIGGILRSVHVGKISAGLSGVMRMWFRQLFLVHKAASDGFVVHTRGGPILIFLVVHDITQDEAAHKYMFGIKGQAGLKCCSLKCSNCMLGRSGLAGHGRLVSSDEPDFNKFIPQTDASVYRIVDHLTHVAATAPRRLAATETKLGFNYLKDGLLFDISLRPYVKPSHVSFDPSHIFLVSGVAQRELQLFLGAAGRVWVHVRTHSRADADMDNAALHCRPTTRALFQRGPRKSRRRLGALQVRRLRDVDNLPTGS